VRLLSAVRRKELLLAAAATALVPALLLVLEAGFRIARGPARPLSWDDMSGVYRYSESYGWEPRPGFAAEIEGSRVTINARGYRGREHRYERTPGHTRVVLLGDSLTFGFRMSDDAIFASLLDGGALEVVNLGVEGYGTDQELLKLEHEGLLYHPDVVVLNVCIENDLIDNWTSENLFHLGYPRPFFRIEDGVLREHDEKLRLSLAGRLGNALQEHSLLYRSLASPVARTGLPREHWRRLRREALSDPRPLLALACRLMRRMDELSRAHGARFVVLLHPNRRALEGDEPLVAALVGARELEGIPVVDLRREYPKPRAWSELLLDASGHLNGFGHRSAAAAIRRVLAPYLT
jgi:hypothetical protein